MKRQQGWIIGCIGGGQLLQHIGQPVEKIDIVLLAGCHQAENNRGSVTTSRRVKVHPVFPANCDGSDRSLRGIVANLQQAMIHILDQGIPLVQRIGRRYAERKKRGQIYFAR